MTNPLIRALSFPNSLVILDLCLRRHRFLKLLLNCCFSGTVALTFFIQIGFHYFHKGHLQLNSSQYRRSLYCSSSMKASWICRRCHLLLDCRILYILQVSHCDAMINIILSYFNVDLWQPINLITSHHPHFITIEE